MTWKTLEGQC